MLTKPEHLHFSDFAAIIFSIIKAAGDKRAHSSLRVLTNRAQEDDVRRFLADALTGTEQGDQNNVDSILQVSVSANNQVYERIRRDTVMCHALRELMKDEIQKDYDKGRAEGIRALVDVYRDDLGWDDQAIIDKLSDRFGLTGDQAKAYVQSAI